MVTDKENEVSLPLVKEKATNTGQLGIQNQNLSSLERHMFSKREGLDDVSLQSNCLYTPK